MHRRIVAWFAGAAAIFAGIAVAQAPPPKFDVTSIRRCTDPGPGRFSQTYSPGRLILRCVNVPNVMRQAYVQYANGRLNAPSAVPVLTEGGPAWLASENFDISATAEDQASEAMMRGPMMQAMLEDRFKLKFHREVREVPTYELKLAKNDTKLRKFEEATCTPRDATKPPGEQKPTACIGGSISSNGRSFTVRWEGASLDQLAVALYGIGASSFRPIVNKTGSTAVYFFRLQFAALTPAAGPATDDSDLPSIFTALEEQLGLKLEPSKGPQEFLVVDGVERPSEN
jgi:uncharacterized protein (TIGR03435 family)